MGYDHVPKPPARILDSQSVTFGPQRGEWGMDGWDLDHIKVDGIYVGHGSTEMVSERKIWPYLLRGLL